MKIKRVLIRNWRSIKEVDFKPADITVLIGANNAGKTNILSAINFLLGDRYPMPANLEDSDFYNGNRSNHIHIELHFEHPEFEKIDFNTSRYKYAVQLYPIGQEKGFTPNNQHRDSLPFGYVDASRSFEKQFGSSKWALFGQALRQMHISLSADTQRVERLKKTLDSAQQLLKTDQYTAFEDALKTSFTEQLRKVQYDVSFDFKTLDESNLYRGLFPMIMERGQSRNPAEVGSGVRNLLVLALFQAFAKSFKGSAVLGIEEPELFLHPHAQRSLMSRFELMAAEGTQLFISSHNANFIDITRSDRLVLVKRDADDEGDICTQTRSTSLTEIVGLRKKLHPEKSITEDSLKAFFTNISTLEMNEAYFSDFIVIVEGPSERESLPIYAKALGLDFDEWGISIVSAGGKTQIDTLYHAYHAHQIPMYIIFDNDKDESEKDRAYNKAMCRLLNIEESSLPAAIVTEYYAILDGDLEKNTAIAINSAEAEKYESLVEEAKAALGISGTGNKPLIARFIANKLASENNIPIFIQKIITHIKNKVQPQVQEVELTQRAA